MTEIAIALCTDGKYALYLAPLIQSIIEHSAADKYYRIVLLDCGINREDLGAVERQISRYANFSLTILSILDWLKQHNKTLVQKGRFPPAIYGRLLIPRLLPDYEKVLYLDIDFIIERDVADLFDMDLGDNYIAASPELPRNIHRIRGDYIETNLGLADSDYYINSGLLVFNIKEWLKNDIFQKCTERLEKQDLDLPDQDVLNIICKGRIAYLSQGWNILGLLPALLEKENFKIELSRATFITKIVEECKTVCRSGKISIHYAGSWRKPWFFPDIPFGSIWWSYAAKTELYARYLYDLHGSVEKKRILAFHGFSDQKSPQLCPQDSFIKRNKIYYFLNIPLLTVKILADSRKYYLGNFGGKFRFMMIKDKIQKKTIYLFGVKLFTVKNKFYQ